MKSEQIQLAAQELLNKIEESTKPANEIINAYTRTRRYIGSKDRHAITDIIWTTIKNTTTPQWLLNYIPNTELETMQRTSAHTILRVNGDREQIQKQLAAQGIDTMPTPLSPCGLILNKRINLNTLDIYKNGLIEVQDEGSQLVSMATHIQPGDTVLDYCAGAGGKSLCLAQMMQNKGKIVAHDISKISLEKLKKRANRAHATIIHTTLKPQGQFQHVVVDAPCSGSGTWRRNPDGRLKITEQQIHALVKKQATILLLDSIHDSYNFGSIIRSAENFGVDAIIYRKDRQCQITPLVRKISTGAISNINLISVVNLHMVVTKLKENNF